MNKQSYKVLFEVVFTQGNLHVDRGNLFASATVLHVSVYYTIYGI